MRGREACEGRRPWAHARAHKHKHVCPQSLTPSPVPPRSSTPLHPLPAVREKLKTATRRRAEAVGECDAAEARAARSEEARATAEGESMKLRSRVNELECAQGAVREEAERGWMGLEEAQQRLGASREAEESLRRELGKQRMRSEDAERAASESSRRVRALEQELEEAKNATKDLALEHKVRAARGRAQRGGKGVPACTDRARRWLTVARAKWGQIASRRSVNLIKDLKQQLSRAKRAKEEVQQRCDTLESQLAEAKAQRDLQLPSAHGQQQHQGQGERSSDPRVARSASASNVREAAGNERSVSAVAAESATARASGARDAHMCNAKERDVTQALALRLEALLQENATVREKVAFLERNAQLLTQDLEEKKRLLAQFTSADKVGGVHLAWWRAASAGATPVGAAARESLAPTSPTRARCRCSDRFFFTPACPARAERGPGSGRCPGRDGA